MKRRRMAACMGDKTGLYRAVVKGTGGKRQLGRPRRRWEDNIKKWIFKKWDGACTGLKSLRIGTGFCELGNETVGSVKCGEFLQ
jgi:hypothetical protein